MTESIQLTEKQFIGGRFMIMRGNSRISLWNEINYVPVRWTFGKYPDARYNPFLTAPKQWLSTETITRANKITAASYLTFNTKDNWVRVFASIGLGVNFNLYSSFQEVETYSYWHQDSITGFTHDSTSDIIHEKQYSKFEPGGFYLGFQTGFIFKISGGFYLFLTGHAVRYFFDRTIPLLDYHSVFSADIGLSYNLSCKKQPKPPPQ
jgi:hypothetical protein